MTKHRLIWWPLQFLVWALCALVIAWMADYPLYPAPAPLPKRTSSAPSYRPPEFCFMIWAGTNYRTCFNADGTYSATPFVGGGGVWKGHWHTKPMGANAVQHLCIKERSGESNTIEWEVPLLEAMGLSGAKTRAGFTEVRLEFAGRAEQ